MKKKLLITLAALISCGVLALVIAQTPAEQEVMFSFDRDSTQGRMTRGELSGPEAFKGSQSKEDFMRETEMDVQEYRRAHPEEEPSVKYRPTGTGN